MPQGKLKVKAKLPTGVKNKAIQKKRDAHFQKKNRPVQPKKGDNKLREEITKSINEHIEETVKQKAASEGKTLNVIKSDAHTSTSSGKKKTK